MHASPVARVALKAGTAAAFTTFTAAPLVRRVMLRAGTLDIPNHRSSHTTPIPRGGGIACVCGAAVGVAAVELTEPTARRRLPAALVAAPLAMAAVGYADDHTGGLPPLPRLAAQALAGAVTATADLPPLVAAAAIVAMPGLVNVVNFMDGINGITGSTAAVWGVNAYLVAQAEQDVTLAVLGAVTAGSGLGFLPWNAPTAKVFLGDAGSYLFGGLFTVGIVAAARGGEGRASATRWRAAMATAAPLLPYVTDTAQAIIRRARAGEPLTEAHREHAYQHLVDHVGLTHARASAAHAFAAITAAASARVGNPAGMAGMAGAAGAYVVAPFALRSARPRPDAGRGSKETA
ncbi:UDP-N-acetylmuramyl pentapeptide phosphotransferase/UDP-N-acetylglucosamine-1-phosphate transferase [Dermacoccus sp. SAI-028]|uniref:MraY family glycosyltransferase n=1 Tax=unclassified Dermacoccus TaxID=2643059 RepID=UPI00104DB5C9|nr:MULTISPECIES: glycosyltransferase family 4 protein [unclassified Dermacoccus]MBO1758274.1 glycosyltransferase family 4 protein [Dermacoccus sp. NHGro5]TCJ92305.1 UDP-N-acetylmuramyl pentapeptide phosphotransferase/UDP-N-acetylglucosamine-1-phosphate transferase [Dermacoccus sp. SAI-028]